jgi:hypothetical protein
LHSWYITFRHPRLGVPLTCVAPPPADFVRALAALRAAIAT